MVTLDVRNLTLANNNETVASDAKVNMDINLLPTYLERFRQQIHGADALVLTGAGPAWIHLSAWHAAHGAVPDGQIVYVAPGLEYKILSAGTATGDGSQIVDGVIVIDIATLVPPPEPGQRLNFDLSKVADYQATALSRLPAFKPGRVLPEFEVVLTGAGPVWLFLALAAALHSRGGPVIYSAPNAPRVVIIDHK